MVMGSGQLTVGKERGKRVRRLLTLKYFDIMDKKINMNILLTSFATSNYAGLRYGRQAFFHYFSPL